MKLLTTILLAFCMLSLYSCVKPGASYRCECSIMYPTGSGTFQGAYKTKGNADVECKERITMAESNGNTAKCEVKEKP